VVGDVAVGYRERLGARRQADRRLGFTGEGPHRHDLRIEVEDRPARGVLSAGQVRTVAAALRLAALAEVEIERDEPLPMVVDDADAELDSLAVERLMAVLAVDRQLLLSSAHPELARRLPPARSLWMHAGSCESRQVSGEVV
jgi:recombinational DNA repair ATPase RecF